MTPLPSPSESYWIACGRPAVDGTDALPPGSVCAACGHPASHGMPMRRWPNAESLILDKLLAPASAHVCRGCVWACTWAAPPGRAAKEGQSRGPAPTMYSHLVEWAPDGPRYASASKGEKPVIRAWLATPREHPWWIVVADMGKKQLIPWAAWNLAPTARGATVHLDDEPCTVGDLALIDAMMHLLTVGATKATLETGHYTPGEWGRCAADLLAFEERHGWHRGSAWFKVALWLAQRDEAAVEERMAEEKATREAKKAAEKEAAKAARGKPAPAPKKPAAKKATRSPASTDAPPAPAPDDTPPPAPTPPPAHADSPHEDDRGPEGTPPHADRGVRARPVPAGAPERVERARPVGPDQQPDARRRPDQRRPGRVDQRDASQPEAQRPEQGQLGLFD